MAAPYLIRSDWDARIWIEGVGEAERRLEVTPAIAGWERLSFRSYTFRAGQVIDGESASDEMSMVLLSGEVTIEIDGHAFFRREGNDVRIELPVTLDEAVGGAKIKVPTVDGAVMLTVAPGSSTGKVLRLKGKGFQAKGGARGDQLVTLQVEIPEGDADLAKRLEGWRDTRDLRAKFGS